MSSGTELSLEDYAAICAELGAGRRPRSEILAARGVGLEAFLHAEALHLRAITADAMADGDGAAAAYATALAAARDALPLPELDEETWLALREDVAQRGVAALVERKLSSDTYARMELARRLGR